MNIRIKFLIFLLIIFLCTNSLLSQNEVKKYDIKDELRKEEILFQVSLVGEVEKPGTYNVKPGTRLAQIYKNKGVN